MARQRRSVPVEKISTNHKPNSHNESTKPSSDVSPVRAVITVVCLIVAGCIGFKGYLETRVNTKFDNEKMVLKTGLDVPERFWGTYRPGVYFGMKTRDPHSLVTGLMWYFPKFIGNDGSGMRHLCEHQDNLQHYSWIEHDGRNFGIQNIKDGPFHLTTSFVKRLGGNHGGDWTARVTVDVNDTKFQGEEVSLIFYAALEDKTNGWIGPHRFDGRLISGIVGETAGLGSFKMTVYNQTGDVLSDSYLSTKTPGLHVLKEAVLGSLHREKGTKKRYVLPGEMLAAADGSRANPNFVALQVTAKLPFDVAFVFESGSVPNRLETLYGDTFERELSKYSDAFHKKFDRTFQLRGKGFSEDEIRFAEAVLSNLVGGIGYFYGSSKVQSSHTEATVPYWKAALYTAVPSRSFFPRGFLWDEGFHGLLLTAWDLDIELDIINHWFDLINIEGWIPREQILGQEALSRVPEEFVTQHNTNANPPTFFLTLRFMLRRYLDRLRAEQKLTALDRLYPRLQAWFEWFNGTQVGDMHGSYRWRGRSTETTRELNPKTLTSGLDDYPRASHPNVDERHVDLRCWIALAASTMAEASQLLARNSNKYDNTFQYLSDPVLLRSLHWSETAQRYSDYGLHTDAVELRKPIPTHRQQGQHMEKARVVLRNPELRFVDTTFGYVSLFPFMLELLTPDRPELGQILDDLKKPNLLWTEFGLRSLSTTSPLYGAFNTEHDPPYWRGPIWINVNYLVIKALNYYSKQEGPYANKAKQLYSDLRKNVINNIFKEYRRTGYVWEQYNDKTGQGQGTRPFTGWTALVVLLMGEIY